MLREVRATTKRHKEEKLKPSWKGPYIIIPNNSLDSYYLEDMNEKRLPHPWNAKYLKKYFV